MRSVRAVFHINALPWMALALPAFSATRHSPTESAAHPWMALYLVEEWSAHPGRRSGDVVNAIAPAAMIPDELLARITPWFSG